MRNNKIIRRYCSYCGRRQYEDKMQRVWYKLLRREAWHCQKCMSAAGDNLHFIPGYKKRYLLELYSGSKTVSNIAAGEFNYEIFPIDVEPEYDPALCCDISKMRLTQIPESKRVSIVWASIPCTFYTIMNIKGHWDKITYSHRQYYYIPKTQEARGAIQLLEKTLWIIKKINPVYYFIENPRGALRHMPQMNFAPFVHTVSYNDFGTDIYKPTDIFTNCNYLQFPRIRTAVGRTFKSSVLDLRTSYDRSVVPPELVRSILSQINKAHNK